MMTKKERKRRTAALVRAWKRGGGRRKRWAESELLKLHAGFVYSAAGADANFEGKKDLINEASITILRTLEEFEEERGVEFLTFWAYKIHGAVSKWWHYWRKNRAFSLDKIVSSGGNYLDLLSAKTQSEEYGNREYDIKHLVGICVNLSEMERELMVGMGFHGLSVDFFCEKWGITRQAVYTRKQKAIAKMRRFLRNG